MNRITLKCLVIALLSLLLAAAASCGQTRESPPATITDNGTGSALSATAAAAASETTTVPAISPEATKSPEIVFDMSGNQTNMYAENLYIEANATSISVIGNGKEPVLISGTIAYFDSYSSSLSYPVSQVEYAMDGSSLAIQLDCNTYGSGRLVYTDGRTNVEIASDVDSFHLSGDGSAILYLVTPKYEHGIGGDLYYYDCVTGISRLIVRGAGRLYTISPCGDSISYTTFYKVDDPDALTCYSLVIGKTPTIVDTDSYCAAISDDAGTIYYMKKTLEGEILLVSFNGVSRQLSLPDGFESNYEVKSLFFNIDQTQIVFNSDGSAYFSMSGSDPYKISDFPVRSFIGKSPYNDIPDYLYKRIADSARSYIMTSVYGTKNLCYAPFQAGDFDLVFFDEQMKVTEYTLPEYSYDCSLSGNVLITRGNDGCTISENYPDPDFVELPAVTSAYATEDQTLYYLSPSESTGMDSDPAAYIDNLYVTFGSFDTTKGELLASNVVNAQLFEREGPDILYFLTFPEGHDEDIASDYYLRLFGDLYAVEEIPGAKPVLIAEKAYMSGTGDFGVEYWQYNSESKDGFESSYEPYPATVNVYWSDDGKSFQYVMERPFSFQFGG